MVKLNLKDALLLGHVAVNIDMSYDELVFIENYMTAHNLNKLNYLQKKKVHLLYLQDRHKRAKDTKRER